MAFFDDEKNVDQYIQMAKGYDGQELIAILKQHLPVGSTVLELGMGPGTDLDLLSQDYKVTGSDSSGIFLQNYRDKHPDADLLKLDAVTVETERTFNCIYSNKVLHHLAKPDLPRSFARQRELLSEGGLLMHSFWYGDKEEDMHGLRFVYYTEEQVLNVIGTGFEVVARERFKEFEADDSFYLLLRRGA